eukprot:GHVP01035274.1.p1 GENE.GHVP01035274.1~~GHVP01035274.1.p1  ORF type:complete len:646 (+),score=117.15 GHVP01035274.1:6462-8399(+)
MAVTHVLIIPFVPGVAGVAIILLSIISTSQKGRRSTFILLGGLLGLSGALLFQLVRLILAFYHVFCISVNLFMFAVLHFIRHQVDKHTTPTPEQILKKKLKSASSYTEWKEIAISINEKRNPEWYKETTDDILDLVAMEQHRERMKSAREAKDIQLIMSLLKVACNRNFCGLGHPDILGGHVFSISHAIDIFVDEVKACISFLIEDPGYSRKQRDSLDFDPPLESNIEEVSDEEKESNSKIRSVGVQAGIPTASRFNARNAIRSRTLCGAFRRIDTALELHGASLCRRGPSPVFRLDQERLRVFLEEVRISMGRTALCLSGGGALAMYHLGVVKVLMENGLLPRVVSGTSGGSIVACKLAYSTDEELINEIIQPDISNRHGVRWFPTLWKQAIRFTKTGCALDTEEFQKTCQAYFKELTFQEAKARTGRLVSVVISPPTKKGSPLLINAITAPDVYLWSAVVVSCALPGLLPAQTLYAKGSDGKPVTFFPSSQQWIDGSICLDLPTVELGALFNAKNFIVSQTNIHASPFVRSIGKPSLFSKFIEWLKFDIRMHYQKLSQMKMIPKFYGCEVDDFFMTQQQEGNFTITPPGSLTDFYRMLSHPEEEDMRDFIEQGSQRTFEHVERIRYSSKIEAALRNAWLTVIS